VAAPLASYIPLATLAAVLATVAWNMAEKYEFATLLRASRGDAVVLLATFLLTVFRDLTEGIVVGFAIGTLLFMHRMAYAVQVESVRPAIVLEKHDSSTTLFARKGCVESTPVSRIATVVPVPSYPAVHA